MALTATLGFPRIGKRRELKRAIEAYWNQKISREELLATARSLREERWRLQQVAGIDLIPSNDFSLYDHVLDTAVMVGAIPERFGWYAEPGSIDQVFDLDLYFTLARGGAVPPLEMTKWFDTNYHYLVPEFTRGQSFRLTTTKPVDEFLEARALGIRTVPVLLGPISFLLLGKPVEDEFHPLHLLPRLLPVYEELLRRLHAAGADWVQMDEPCLVLDQTAEELERYREAYEQLAAAAPLRLLVATYFGGVGEHLPQVLDLPVAGIHLDLVRGATQWPDLLEANLAEDKFLSLGVVDGRNVWRTDLDCIFTCLQVAAERFGAQRIIVSPSCSLLHVPWDVELETNMDPQIKAWLAFAAQKLEELQILRRALNEGPEAVADAFAAQRAAFVSRQNHPHVRRPEVRSRAAAEADQPFQRADRAERKRMQQAALGLPLLPTTTIGSFPQTVEVRKARADARKGLLSVEAYEAFLRDQIARCVRLQEDLGLDVLVHGEFERTDMVEYFAEQLEGCLVTQYGWVQSYGTRCVKPPIIYGDVSRPRSMTVNWAVFAQSLTNRPVKGMLTGPVTILHWSFVRDDQPREETCRQIALAVRDEVLDLERAGIRVIQIDEPALREGLPLRRAQWDKYFAWAVACFRLAYAGVKDETQIHTHMCYAEFADILPAIDAMDVDVISLEAARSRMDSVSAYQGRSPAYDVGPGVYDIHSPRVPSTEEILLLLEKACDMFSPEQLWVNPDCGLKTRKQEEVRAALRHMVEAAQQMRERLGSG